METSKEERPVVAKRLRNRNISVMETSKEDGPVEAKRRRTGNLDHQKLESKVDKNLKPLIPSSSLEPQNIQEKQQIMEDLKALGASKSKLQAEIAEKQAQIDQITKKEDRLKELMGPLLETMLPDEILLKILGYLSTSDVLRNVARVSKKFKKLSEDYTWEQTKNSLFSLLCQQRKFFAKNRMQRKQRKT